MADDTPETPYLKIGGEPAIDRLVDRFYHHMSTLQEAQNIRAMHTEDLAEIRKVLKLYLGQWLGGPGLYSAERGHPRLRQRHLPFSIGEAERDAWMLCMLSALGEIIPDDHELREILGRSFYQLADWMRNREDKITLPRN